MLQDGSVMLVCLCHLSETFFFLKTFFCLVSYVMLLSLLLVSPRTKGILTAHSVMGYGGPSDIVSGRNMVEDLWHLDERNKKAGKDRFCIPVAEEDKGSTKKVK